MSKDYYKSPRSRLLITLISELHLSNLKLFTFIYIECFGNSIDPDLAYIQHVISRHLAFHTLKRIPRPQAIYKAIFNLNPIRRRPSYLDQLLKHQKVSEALQDVCPLTMPSVAPPLPPAPTRVRLIFFPRSSCVDNEILAAKTYSTLEQR